MIRCSERGCSSPGWPTPSCCVRVCQVDESHLSADVPLDLNDNDSDESVAGADAEDLRVAARLKASLGGSSIRRSPFGSNPASPRLPRYVSLHHVVLDDKRHQPECCQCSSVPVFLLHEGLSCLFPVRVVVW